MSKENHIEKRKRTSGSEAAYVGASRIRVSDVVLAYELALDELVLKRVHQTYPTLTLDEVEAAIRYWRANREEILREIVEDAEAFARFVDIKPAS